MSDLAVVADDLRDDRTAVAPDERPSDAETSPPQGPERRADVQAQLDEIIAEVERIRELTFPSPPTIRYVTSDELRTEITELIGEIDADQEEADLRLLVALGIADRDFDLGAAVTANLGDQVAGFYDPASKELVVRTEAGAGLLSPFDELILAHELAHSLVDATLGLPDLEGYEDHEGEAILAAQALVEGDATSVMNQYALESFSLSEQIALGQEALAQSGGFSTASASAIEHQLAFPYIEGSLFVDFVRFGGGWDAVNELILRPPSTTLEILEPRLLGQIDASSVSTPSSPGVDWDFVRSGTFGAFDLLSLLEAPGNDPEVAIAQAQRFATTWRDGVFEQWHRGDDTVVSVAMVTDTSDLSACDGIRRWYAAAFTNAQGMTQGNTTTFTGPDQAFALVCTDDLITFAVAPDLGTAESVVS